MMMKYLCSTGWILLALNAPVFADIKTLFDIGISRNILVEVEQKCFSSQLSGGICDSFWQSSYFEQARGELFAPNDILPDAAGTSDIESYGLVLLSDGALLAISQRCNSVGRTRSLCRELEEEISIRSLATNEEEVFEEAHNLRFIEGRFCNGNICSQINGGIQQIELTPSQADRLGITY